MSAVFDAYAEYYDLLYQDKNYQKEVEYIVQLIKKFHPQATSILDIGCGTGKHAEYLARLGFNVHGVDLSDAMLNKANERKKNLPIELANRLSFSQGDACSVRIGTTFDVVISLFHVMSYQNDNKDVFAVLNTAKAHIKNDGLFLFDFWYGPAVLKQTPETRIKRLENESVLVTRIAEPIVRTELNVVDVNYDVFIKEKSSNTVGKVNESHYMRYFFMPEIQLILELTHWSKQAAYGWETNEPPSEKAWATIVVCTPNDNS